ncbi:hypothetical protein [Flavivirga algicola]|uniref:Lipoprotein n=1 Tax=Flavivirga algicola TaxID=2729136 RepID=A0ABX1RXI2_9FLAO|nr:hypothetical protein [Flavivirga algicola]NMH86914.1 hypothetical protein [Flavivirga algicola]
MKKPEQKHNLYILVCMMCLFVASCSSQKTASTAKSITEDIATGNGKYIISALVVFKDFVLKNGETTKHKDAYLRRSNQDYYIKFCKSKISRKDLEKHLSKINKAVKVATLEVEFRNGLWDVCDGNFEQQSRKGAYVIVHRIVEK